MRVTEFALQLPVITDTGADVQGCRRTGARYASVKDYARRPLIGFGRTTTPAASEEMYYSVFLSPCFLFFPFPFYNDDGMLYNSKAASMPEFLAQFLIDRSITKRQKMPIKLLLSELV